MSLFYILQGVDKCVAHLKILSVPKPRTYKWKTAKRNMLKMPVLMTPIGMMHLRGNDGDISTHKRTAYNI